MPKFRKKPVVIDAVQWKGLEFIDDAEGLIGPGFTVRDNCLLIKTLEGVMAANVGDWVIKGIKGEFYPCKPDIFEATYERVEGTSE